MYPRLVVAVVVVASVVVMWCTVLIPTWCCAIGERLTNIRFANDITMFTQSHGTIFSELCCDGFGGAQNTCIPAVVSGGGHVVSVKGHLLVVQLPFL